MKRIFPHILLALAALSCTVAGNEEDVQESPVDSLVPVKVHVKFREGLPPVKSASAFAGAFEVESMERVFPASGRFEKRTIEAGLDRWYRVSFKSGCVPTKAGIDGLELLECLEEIPHAGLCSVSPLCDDEYFSRQWYLGNDPEEQQYGINVLPVWEEYTRGS
mgnify:FL=1